MCARTKQPLHVTPLERRDMCRDNLRPTAVAASAAPRRRQPHSIVVPAPLTGTTSRERSLESLRLRATHCRGAARCSGRAAPSPPSQTRTTRSTWGCTTHTCTAEPTPACTAPCLWPAPLQRPGRVARPELWRRCSPPHPPDDTQRHPRQRYHPHEMRHSGLHFHEPTTSVTHDTLCECNLLY